MPRSPGKLAALILVLVALGLGGCASAGPTPSPDPLAESPGASVIPSESPASGPDPDDPSTWVISAEGIGPLRLGDHIDAALAAVPAFVEPADAEIHCPNPAITFLGPPGGSLAEAPILLAARETGTVVAVVVSAAGPATAAGVGVGSTMGDVRTAYPSAVESLRYETTPQLTVESDSGWITFESGDGTAADAAPIGLVSVLTGSTPPNEYCG